MNKYVETRLKDDPNKEYLLQALLRYCNFVGALLWIIELFEWLDKTLQKTFRSVQQNQFCVCQQTQQKVNATILFLADKQVRK